MWKKYHDPKTSDADKIECMEVALECQKTIIIMTEEMLKNHYAGAYHRSSHSHSHTDIEK